jgi:hypothetical protein
MEGLKCLVKDKRTPRNQAEDNLEKFMYCRMNNGKDLCTIFLRNIADLYYPSKEDKTFDSQVYQ